MVSGRAVATSVCLALLGAVIARPSLRHANEMHHSAVQVGGIDVSAKTIETRDSDGAATASAVGPGAAAAGNNSGFMRFVSKTVSVKIHGAVATSAVGAGAAVAGDISGFRDFSSETAAFWARELADGGPKWYGTVEDHWVKSPATVDGVLGGFSQVDPEDVRQSAEFIEGARKLRAAAGALPMGRDRAMDGGAGVGRVTKELLCKIFETIDLVEGNQRMLDAAPVLMAESRNHLGELFCEPLQRFSPVQGSYDCIWVQWVAMYMTDADFAAFLRRCVRGLRPGGMIFIKDNVLQASSPTDLVKDKDKENISVTRSPRLMKHIFQQAGLELVLEKPQENWPSGLMPIRMYATIPTGAAQASTIAQPRRGER